MGRIMANSRKDPSPSRLISILLRLDSHHVSKFINRSKNCYRFLQDYRYQEVAIIIYEVMGVDKRCRSR